MTTTVAVRLRARVTERALFAAGVVAVVSDVDGCADYEPLRPSSLGYVLR